MISVGGKSCLGCAEADEDDSAKCAAVSRHAGECPFCYVTSYDGDQFNPNLLPEDRQAIATVQDAMQKWGKFTLVYEPIRPISCSWS